MSVVGASYYRPSLASSTSDPTQFRMQPTVNQSGVMYDSCRRRFVTSSGEYDSPSYEYVPSPSYPVPPGQPSLDFGLKSAGRLPVSYNHGLDGVHSQSATVGTPPPTGPQSGFVVYPWMRSMATGISLIIASYFSAFSTEVGH